MYCERNEFDLVRERVTGIEAIADELQQPSQRWFATTARAMLAVHEGRFVDGERLATRALEIGERAEGVRATGPYAVQLFIVRREQGRAAETLDALTAVADEAPARPFFRAVLAAAYVELDRLPEARLLFEELAANDFEIVPRDNEWLLAGHYLAETCRALRDTVRAATLLEQLEPLAARAAANLPEGSVGTLGRSLAGLAEILGRDDHAVRLLEQAIELDAATGALPWAAHGRVDLAAIAARGGARTRATGLLDEADATASTLGMVRLAARIDALRNAGAQATGNVDFTADSAG